MQQVAFVVAAAALVVLCLGVFAWEFFFAREEKNQAASRLKALQQEYGILQKRRQQGAISTLSFAREEHDLIVRVLRLREELKREKISPRQGTLAVGTFVFCLVAIPLSCVALYGWNGDFSSLSQEAQEQIHYTKTAAQSQKSMAETISQLEKTVQESRNQDNLEAWEILADYYYNNNDLHKAEKAYRQVLRLNEANVPALANLADILVALNQGELTSEVAALNRKALALDPWQDKSLLLAGILAYQKEDYAHAALYWGRLKNMTAVGSELYSVLDTNIRAALTDGKLTEIPHDEYAHKPADLKMGGRGMSMPMPGSRP